MASGVVMCAARGAALSLLPTAAAGAPKRAGATNATASAGTRFVSCRATAATATPGRRAAAVFPARRTAAVRLNANAIDTAALASVDEEEEAEEEDDVLALRPDEVPFDVDDYRAVGLQTLVIHLPAPSSSTL
jgi:hypothetical protein